MAMPGVRALTELVAARIDSAEAGRAQHLRLLRCLRDIHRRPDAACAGLARLVPTHACEEKELGGNSGSRPRTDSGGETIGNKTLT